VWRRRRATDRRGRFDRRSGAFLVDAIAADPATPGLEFRLNQSTIVAMKIVTIIVRILLGLIFVVFGSNAFLHFLPMPPLPKGPASDFATALFGTGYMYVVASIQIIGGLFLLIGRFVALGLTLLCPVIVNILCFHAFLDHSGLPLAIAVAVVGLFLVWRYRTAFSGIFQP
jgi:putative oxidoreductase